jgi:hypothetical protein
MGFCSIVNMRNRQLTLAAAEWEFFNEIKKDLKLKILQNKFFEGFEPIFHHSFK